MEYIINSKKYGKQTVLLDEEDYNEIVKNNYKLHLKYDKTINGFYVQFHYPDLKQKDGRGTIGLHRWVMDNPKNKQIDHINRNPLDNRKSNLRVVTCQENSQNKGEYKNNKSGVKNIYYSTSRDRWIVEIKHNKKVLGRKICRTLEEAKVQKEFLLKKFNLQGGDVKCRTTK